MNAEQAPPPMARPRVAAGALFFDDQQRVLLVKPTYKETWDIPGGYVEPGESPRDACIREVYEELGIKPPIGRLLVVDWAPNDADGDKLLFIFDGGALTSERVADIRLPHHELADYAFVAVKGFPRYMNDRLVRRVGAAAQSRAEGRMDDLEHGMQPNLP